MKNYFPSLAGTVDLMQSDNYKNRMIAEYHQTKIRYEKLKDLCNRIEAAHRTGKEAPKHDSPQFLLSDASNGVWKNEAIANIKNYITMEMAKTDLRNIALIG